MGWGFLQERHALLNNFCLGVRHLRTSASLLAGRILRKLTPPTRIDGGANGIIRARNQAGAGLEIVVRPHSRGYLRDEVHGAEPLRLPRLQHLRAEQAQVAGSTSVRAATAGTQRSSWLSAVASGTEIRIPP